MIWVRLVIFGIVRLRGILVGFEIPMVVRILFEAGKNAGNGTRRCFDKKRGVLRIMVRRLRRI